MYVQYGCGFSAPEGWLNFDSSPTLRAEKLPLLGVFLSKNSSRFPSNVRSGDIVRGLPVKQDSANGVYASHVLEHLARSDFVSALKNTYRIMRPGGIFRLIVPDLEARTKIYLSKLGAGEFQANDWFMGATVLGLEHRPRTLMGKISRFAGGSAHLWMWDFPSMEAALSQAGFVSIRRCCLGDSDDPMFSRVESADRFTDIANGIPELAVQCSKPPFGPYRIDEGRVVGL